MSPPIFFRFEASFIRPRSSKIFQWRYLFKKFLHHFLRLSRILLSTYFFGKFSMKLQLELTCCIWSAVPSLIIRFSSLSVFHSLLFSQIFALCSLPLAFSLICELLILRTGNIYLFILSCFIATSKVMKICIFPYAFLWRFL